MLRPFFRLLDFVGVELLAVIRQPFLLLALVLGPFIILFIFGIGHRAVQPLTTILVIPERFEVNRDVGYWRDRFGGSLQIVAVISDEASAVAAVHNRSADLAVLLPSDAADTFAGGRSVTLRVVTNQIDPVQRSFVDFASYVLASELNKQVIVEAATRLQQQVRQQQGAVTAPAKAVATVEPGVAGWLSFVSNIAAIPPPVLASPFVGRVENIAPISPEFAAFYGPSVLALLLQHLAVTLASLSIVRERLLGAIELYQVAPTSSAGLLLSKLVGYGLICLVVAVALVALMTRGLNVPLRGDLATIGLAIGLLVFASLGVGLFLSLLSTSEENAVQYAMLVLLASVFFSGFFLPVTSLQPPASQITDALPVTYGIIALQELMLRGQRPSDLVFIVLAAMGGFFWMVSMLLFSHELRRR